MTTLFISDLHLSPSQPQITDCFVKFMREEAVHAEALYVLGDLFEFWIGDDDPSDFAQAIKAEFKTLTQSGVSCYFIQGNRDFLLNRRFCKETGIKLLDEHSVIDLYGRKTVILHGDTLCTEDHKYQAFRAKVHMPWLQWIFNRLPFFTRQHIVNKIQGDIRDVKAQKSLDIMDVTQSEVETLMKQCGTDLMIHGHTHRPNIHQFEVDNKPYTRIVLGDWYQQGSVLVCTPESQHLEVRRFA
ncbi:UDP-2,3-diacylglucosamine diphosphatase [Vibrio mediterranei]|uniref:UDP-2,3-diacylglucosamine diphosphatase n=1 Tax=Vibrio TaxID=662 RepID=UPI000570DB5B|nr:MULTISPECIES: UDP-2,3-diacylglucosamine diphosphatase [Vibrio]MCY9851299.1 UDP-2,3-diacylglucosamine diphosphatase [Vibrio mediterranei]MDA0109189.1 UDP-2,3-diacylglucosamine diphosphatase [Vibrio sp. La 4.2.2]NUW72989.1 UDP-2,3-diacylglucosamine diphosphatase [Vibrio mediterranei]